MGSVIEAEVGAIAHGGHCVARIPGAPGSERSRVVFVRHALPGERVVVRITEGTDGDSFWRGDAIEVLEPAADRADPPCPVAGPGLCGGCDFQHVAIEAQRGLKADVVREQLNRVGGFNATDPLLVGLRVASVPVPHQPDDGLRWRTRTRFVTGPDGRIGLRRHRSHDVVAVDDCLITAVSGQADSPDAPAETRRTATCEEHVRTSSASHRFIRSAAGFWQVHSEAPRVLVEAVLELLDPRPGESMLDLFGGVGLFARFIADRTAPTGRVSLVEGDSQAVHHARTNLGPSASVHQGDVADVLSRDLSESVDLVVLDPPRAGAKRAVVEAVVRRQPRAVAYVACDPAALARDLAIFREAGYRVREIRAFDLFPMTHHVECVALIEPR